MLVVVVSPETADAVAVASSDALTVDAESDVASKLGVSDVGLAKKPTEDVLSGASALFG